ncbi:50S ribosomal protein L7ae-like protein [Clostridium hydrogeniformans]|uniref:50S ribosomal protein L7ae-like protein n=1 Tax=Clostridium hydrogeniformans TaxID=349933 RepID=UPI00068C5E11|nr:50S ribosomal protein L7ae-like protein [Clostridium hydrogeniformans]
MRNKFYNFLGLTKRAGNLLEGYNKCEEYIRRKRPCLIILAKEISNNSRDKFLRYCTEKNVPVIENLPKEELGNALGREELKVLCVTDSNMATKLLELRKSLESEINFIGGEESCQK